MDVGLLLLRLVVGGVMAAHGAQKLFGWFGGYGIHGTGGWLESLGFKPGKLQATIVGWTELVSGVLLAVGFFTPFAAAAIIGVMVVAIATVHWENGFFNTAGGYEFNLVLIAAAATVALTGTGAMSIDQALGLDMSGMGWGFVALALGGLTGAVVVSMRQQTLAQEEVVEEEEEDEETRVIDLREEEKERV